MGGLTIDDPVLLKTACASSRIIPGDTLLLRGGTYTGDYVFTASGTIDAPITIKPYNGEHVVIDGTFKFSNHLHVYDIDFTDTRAERLWQYYGEAADEGVTMTGQGNRMHGCMVTQQRSSGVNWFGSEGTGGGEISENVFLLNGIRYADNSGHGHSLYSHNNVGGLRKILRNSFYLNLGDYTLQLYSASNKTDDYDIEDNTFQGPAFMGGHFGPNNLTFKNNCNWYGTFQIATGMGTHTCDGMTIQGNTMLDAYAYNVGGAPGELTNLTEADNLFYGGYRYGTHQTAPHAGYTYADLPEYWTKVVAFTKSERWLALVTIYTRDAQNSVSVDFTGVLENGTYQLRNTQNMTETWAFTWAGDAVAVPTNFTSGAFIGDDYQPATTFPKFGSFVVEAT